MTLVNHDTGEIIEYDRPAAERRAQQIEARLSAIGESFAVAMEKIREAIELRDDIALGYRSPGEYVSARFGRALSGLPVEMRREAVRELTEAGMSTRAIAPVVGVDYSTVARDVSAGVAGATPGVLRDMQVTNGLSPDSRCPNHPQSPAPAELGKAKRARGLTLRAGACPACFQARLDDPRGPGVKPWQHGAQWRKNLPAEPARTPRRTLRARLLGRLKTPA